MSKRKKRLERIRQNPKNVSFEELRQVLEDYGFVLDRVVGSHYSFKRMQNSSLFVLPYRKPAVKVVYVKKALQLIDTLGEDQDDNFDE